MQLKGPMAIFAAAQLAAFGSAADCKDSKGSSELSFWPSSQAYSAWSEAVGRLDNQGTEDIYDAYRRGIRMVTLQKDCRGAWDRNNVVSHLYDAFNNIWNQCMDASYNKRDCDKSYETGTWSYEGQWYWMKWYSQNSGAREVKHCGLLQANELSEPQSLRSERLTVKSVTKRNITLDEVPYPEMYANNPADKLYELTTIEFE